ncbi:MAG: hypothetical protein IT460_03995 [Planctomycetes bacterium]|nr:hypothetical protein [Planctomycetota bacterium]
MAQSDERSDRPSESELQRRRAWFHRYVEQVESGVTRPAEAGVTYTCPCCGYPTLADRGGYDICDLCWWEDDGQDDHDATVVRGGPNKHYSLAAARANWTAYGSMYDPEHEINALSVEREQQAQLKRQIVEKLEPYRWAREVELPLVMEGEVRTLLQRLRAIWSH